MKKPIDLICELAAIHPSQEDERERAFTAMLLACGPPPLQSAYRTLVSQPSKEYQIWEHELLCWMCERDTNTHVRVVEKVLHAKEIDQFIVWIGVHEMKKHLQEQDSETVITMGQEAEGHQREQDASRCTGSKQAIRESEVQGNE